MHFYVPFMIKGGKFLKKLWCVGGDEGLTLETSALETLMMADLHLKFYIYPYLQWIKPNYPCVP